MPLEKIAIKPGIVKDTTPAVAEGRWVDSDKIRFHLGLPRVIGGWQIINISKRVVTLTNPFTTTSGSNLVTVVDPGKPAVTGDKVSFKDVLPVGGLDFNASFQVTEVINNNTYTITTDRPAISDDTGGGGDVEALYTPIFGVIRNLQSWTSDNGLKFQAIGTDSKIYISTGDSIRDITPQDRTVILTNPFTTVLGSNVVTVADAGHDAIENQGVVYSGATAVGGLTLNGSFRVQTIIDANTYTIESPTVATSGATGGGTVTALYDIPVLPEVVDEGWSNHRWSGNFGWSESLMDDQESVYPVNWFMALFGQTLLFAPRGGTLYKWDPSVDGVTTRGKLVADAPTAISGGLIVIPQNRQVVVVGGVRPVGEPGVSSSPTQIIWSAANSYLDWVPSDINIAGNTYAGGVSRLIAARLVNNQIVIWSETKIFLLTFIGTPSIFNLNSADTHSGLLGPNSCVVAEGVVYWMGDNNFYVYNGANPVTLPSTVRDFVFANVNIEQQEKVYGFSNSGFSEIWWFYPSQGQLECDSYVTYNYLEKVWTVGSFKISAAEDRGPQNYPIWAHDNQYLYDHEIGTTADGALIPAMILSGPLDIAGSEDFVFADRVIPDLALIGGVNLTIGCRAYPNSIPIVSGPFNFLPTSTEVYPRARGRSLDFKFESTDEGNPEKTDWRLGMIIVSLQPKGKK